MGALDPVTSMARRALLARQEEEEGRLVTVTVVRSSRVASVDVLRLFAVFLDCSMVSFARVI